MLLWMENEPNPNELVHKLQMNDTFKDDMI